MPRKHLEALESDPRDLVAMADLRNALAAEPSPNRLDVFLRLGENSVRLPESIVLGLRDLAQHLARGSAVQVVPLDRKLSLSESAQILGVSRKFVRRLVHRGEIQADRVGRHYRLALADVMSYRHRHLERRRNALLELREFSAELGAYDSIK
jgi:excisionase family DNA binding protein